MSKENFRDLSSICLPQMLIRHRRAKGDGGKPLASDRRLVLLPEKESQSV